MSNRIIIDERNDLYDGEHDEEDGQSFSEWKEQIYSCSIPFKVVQIDIEWDLLIVLVSITYLIDIAYGQL